MKIAVLGASGMLGHKMIRVFKSAGMNVDGFVRPQFDALSPDFSVVANYDYIINCIGIIKPYIRDNRDDIERAIRVNALFPHLLANIDARVIQIATDCVWDGTRGGYRETDAHNATDVYGKTKSLGEVASNNFLNLRCSIIGGEEKGYLSLLEWFLRRPRNASVNGYMNHFWNGLTTDAFANICVGIIKNDAWFPGMTHIVPADIVSKAQMLRIFAERFNRTDIKISDINADVAIDRTISTNNPTRNETLWRNAGYGRIPTIKQMIDEMAR